MLLEEEQSTVIPDRLGPAKQESVKRSDPKGHPVLHHFFLSSDSPDSSLGLEGESRWQ